ncbi:MAG: MFS transporter, partial [Erythrobacter sp.]|nr:MFS transporter [Erythrobacter sp.]
QMLAGIAVAGPISLFMGRFGRRAGFLLGAMALVVGGGLAIVAVQAMSFALLCLAHAMLGGALICFNFFRFAASEAVSPELRPQAISLTLASGLVAALIGPEVFAFSKDALAPLPLAGAYVGIVALGFLGALPVLGLSMPAARPAQTQLVRANIKGIVLENPRVLRAILVAALSQAVMVLLMTPTPLAMVGCGFGDTQAADVIRWHIVAMFGPGFFTGSIIAQFGAGRVAAAGVALLLISAIIAWSGMDLLNFYTALMILGVGWNFAFVSSTQMLQSELSEEEAPAMQGFNDTILAIAAALASLLSGALYVGMGWVGLATFAIPMTLVIATLLYQARRRETAATSPSS